MNFFEAQEFFKNMYPGKDIKFEFDEKCHRFHEIVYTDGSPHVFNHVENHKVKITVEGMDAIYVPISPHRENYSWADIKKLINSKDDVFISDDQLKNISELTENDQNQTIQEISKLSDLDNEQIKSKVANYKSKIQSSI